MGLIHGGTKLVPQDCISWFNRFEFGLDIIILMLERNTENYNYYTSERRTEQSESNTVFVKDISELFEKLFRTSDLSGALTQRGTAVVVGHAFETSDQHILKKDGIFFFAED